MSNPPDYGTGTRADNASSHTSEEVEKWLGEQNGKVVFHFTPTGASWMNMIEIWNGIITRKAIRRGTHSSVKVLARDILAFTEHSKQRLRSIRMDGDRRKNPQEGKDDYIQHDET